MDDDILTYYRNIVLRLGPQRTIQVLEWGGGDCHNFLETS